MASDKFPVIAEESPAVSDPRWLIVQRVASSSTFEKSLRLRNFFLYVCQRTLENRLDEVREQQIGYHVFGRKADYNSSDDSIVRVEARNLRKRLEEYFATAGAKEPFIVTIPKGSYVPRFDAREESRPAFVTVPEIRLPETTVTPPALPQNPIRSTTVVRTYLPWLLCTLLAAALVFVIASRSPVAAKPVSQTPFWGSLFNNDSETFVVCADSSWVLRQDVLGKALTLDDYISMNWNVPAHPDPSSAPNATLSLLPLKQYTSMADVRLVEQLLLLNGPYWKRTSIRSARSLQMRDLKDGNLILIGSIRAMPWLDLFKSRLKFWVDYDYDVHRPVVRNQHPLPGEPPTLHNGPEGGPLSYVYSVISYIPNLSQSGRILVIAGSSMEGTQAAGEYITNPRSLAKLLSTVGYRQGTSNASFEAVLKSNTMAGTPGSSEIVAFRPSRSFPPETAK